MEYTSSSHELDTLIKGVPIKCMVRVKPSVGYQEEDIRIEGDKVIILDVKNRIKEEFDCNEIYSPGQTMAEIFDTSFPPYLRAFSEGVNVSVFSFGASGSGKTHSMEGNQTDPGMVSLIAGNIFNILEYKRYKHSGAHPDASGKNYSFSIKIRFVEIVDEEIYDLLQPTGAYGHHTLNVVTNEWEGPTINGVAWIPMSNQHQVADYFFSGCKNRTTRSNEFGKLSDKSTGIFSIEITQITENPESGDTNLLSSKIHIIDLPGCEVLTEDPESLKVKEGTTLNRSMLALITLIKDLATSRHGEFIYNDSSLVTQLLKDTFGGNSLTIGLFNLQYGDLLGSVVTMRILQKCQMISNFPVTNDDRILGLLRKYRVELVQLQNQVNMLPGDNADNYNLKIAELEKKLIEENLEKMKMADEKSRLVSKMQEMKQKFNDMVKSKADLQGELIKSEEEKLKVSKALVELQIENTKLKEIVQNAKFENDFKLLHVENDVLKSNIKEERADQAIQYLQDKLREALDEKKEIEIGFVALKKNFINLQSEIDSEQAKNDNLGLELVNLVHENKALQDNSNKVNLKHGDISSEHQKLIRKIKNKLETDVYDKREAIVIAQEEIERLKSELVRADTAEQQNQQDYEEKKMELEREYIEMSKHNLQEMDHSKTDDRNYHKNNALKKEMWDGERIDYQKKIKQLNRKIKEFTDDLKLHEEQNMELKRDKNRVTLQVEEMRSVFRNKLTKYMNENNPDSSTLSWSAKEELIRSYTEKEVEMTQRLAKESKRIEKIYRQLRALKNYARSLKYLAEDWAPIGQPLPEVLTLPPPVTLDDEDDNEFVKQQHSEIDRLKKKNKNLEDKLRQADSKVMTSSYRLAGKSGDAEMQQKLLREIGYLKGNPDVYKKPGTASVEVEKLSKERDNLYKENLKVQNLVDQESSISSLSPFNTSPRGESTIYKASISGPGNYHYYNLALDKGPYVKRGSELRGKKFKSDTPGLES